MRNKAFKLKSERNVTNVEGVHDKGRSCQHCENGLSHLRIGTLSEVSPAVLLLRSTVLLQSMCMATSSVTRKIHPT